MPYVPNGVGFERKKGSVSGSAADPMIWDLSGDTAKAVLVFDCIISGGGTLHIRTAESLEELSTSVQSSLFHDDAATIPSNQNQPVVKAFNPGLPVGKAWVTGTGNYILSGSARAHS